MTQDELRALAEALAEHADRAANYLRAQAEAYANRLRTALGITGDSDD